MKKIILILGLIIVAQLETKAQQEKQFIAAANYTTLKSMYSSGNNLPEKDYAYYKQKRKDNLTAGLVTLGAGLALSGIGLITASNGSGIETADGTTVGLFMIGAVSGIVSIPLMVRAGVNAHKAKLELRNQKTGFGVPSKMRKNITGITVSIPIGK